MRRGWLEAYLRRRFAWLLAFLLLTIGIDPALEQAGLTSRGLETALAFALLAGAVGTGARGTPIAHGLAALFLFMLAGWLVLRVGSFAAAPALAPTLLGVSGLGMAGLVLVSFGYTEIPVADLNPDELIHSFDALPAACLRLLGACGA